MDYGDSNLARIENIAQRGVGTCEDLVHELKLVSEGVDVCVLSTQQAMFILGINQFAMDAIMNTITNEELMKIIAESCGCACGTHYFWVFWLKNCRWNNCPPPPSRENKSFFHEKGGQLFLYIAKLKSQRPWIFTKMITRILDVPA